LEQCQPPRAQDTHVPAPNKRPEVPNDRLKAAGWPGPRTVNAQGTGNQSGAARTLNIEGPQLSRTIGPIQPEDTATLKVTAKPGDLELADGDEGLKPFVDAIGPARPGPQGPPQVP